MEQNQSSSSNNKTNRILIILLALSVIMNFYLWQNKQQVVKEITLVTDSLTVSKAEVDRELAEALDELEDSQDNYISNSAETANKIAKLEFTAADRSKSNAVRRASLKEAIKLSEEEKFDAFIVDEAQTLTRNDVKTIITIAGENTKIIFTGDIYQIDTPYLDAQSNGLSYLIDKVKGQSLYAHITLQKGERSELANLANDLL
jgi:hypothetical protein